MTEDEVDALLQRSRELLTEFPVEDHPMVNSCDRGYLGTAK